MISVGVAADAVVAAREWVCGAGPEANWEADHCGVD